MYKIVNGVKTEFTQAELDLFELNAADVPRIQAEEAKDRIKADLRGMDTHSIRVFHDLVDVLIDKGTISLADLPEAAQNKLSSHKTKREGLV